MITDTVDTTDTLTAVHITLVSQLLHVVNKNTQQCLHITRSLLLDLTALTLIVPISSVQVVLAPARDEVLAIRPFVRDRVMAVVSALYAALTAGGWPLLAVASVVKSILIANRQAVLTRFTTERLASAGFCRVPSYTTTAG
jgi:hypothetical protein